MTEEQEKLVLEIICKLDENAVTGEWPHQKCKFCSGRSEGYHYSQEFAHYHDCNVLLIQQLRKTMW